MNNILLFAGIFLTLLIIRRYLKARSQRITQRAQIVKEFSTVLNDPQYRVKGHYD